MLCFLNVLGNLLEKYKANKSVPPAEPSTLKAATEAKPVKTPPYRAFSKGSVNNGGIFRIETKNELDTI